MQMRTFLQPVAADAPAYQDVRSGDTRTLAEWCALGSGVAAALGCIGTNGRALVEEFIRAGVLVPAIGSAPAVPL